MSRPKLPPHGTVRRYRLELKTGPACERCKAANTKARREQRAAAKRPNLTIVPDTHSENTSTAADTQHTDDRPTTSPEDPKSEPGDMEKAVEADLAAIAEVDQVPFHRSLSTLAKALARETDSAESPTARSAASRQLFEVLKALRAKKEGESGSALDIVLEDFGLPLPGVRT